MSEYEGIGLRVEERSRYFTLMIMPETSAVEVRRIRVSRRVIVSVVACSVLLFFAALAAVGYSIFLLDDAREVTTLRAENSALRSELDGLDGRLEQVTDVVDRVKHFESKLRSLTMISDPERNLAMGPVGGPSQNVKEARDDEAAQLRRDLLNDSERAVDHASARISWIEGAASKAVEGAQSLSVLLEGQHAMLSATPSRRPSRGYVTSGYGMRIDPFTGLAQHHSGIDFSARLGAPVSSTADGVVIFSGKHGAYGNMIEIDHGHGLVTKYAHLSAIHVKVGEKVKRGHMVGEVGNTGRSTGPHLHYEIRLNGIPQDPRRFMLE